MSIAKNRAKSTWTPLSNEDSNNKIFEERRLLVGKWFDKWNNQQRKTVLEDVLLKSKLRQLEFCGDIIKAKVPRYQVDFTRHLPRVLSLYLFSFLDPRSLCRCSQVCWYWKLLIELDQIWMPKCLRLGWYITFTPSPFEQGIWKRHYIESIQSLRCLRPKEISPEASLSNFDQMSVRSSRYSEENENSARKPPRPSSGKKNTIKKPTPWKGSDPVPKDTWRYNYLKNEDEVEKVNKLRKAGLYGPESEEIAQKAKSKVKTGSNKLNHTVRKRSSSLPRENTPTEIPPPSDGRPDWAKHSQGAPYVNQNSNFGHVTASRPAPVRPPSVFKNVRTERDLPTQPLFVQQPWIVPNTEEEDYDSP